MTERQEYWLRKGFEPDLEIEVTFLRPEEGGGSGPWRAFLPSEEEGGVVGWRLGYTPPFYYDERLWIAFYLFAQEVIHPGDTVRALVQFISPGCREYHEKHLYPGKAIELREHLSKAVARGQVIRLLGLASPGTTSPL